MPHKTSKNTMTESKTTTVLNGDSPQSTTLRVRQCFSPPPLYMHD